MMATQSICPNYDEQSNGSATDTPPVRDERGNSIIQSELIEFDVLKVAPEEFAKQLTLLDLDAFKAIAPDEITSCSWVKKEKWKLSPNVCAMTQRFNNTSFWVIREVLNASSLKHRVDVITHFIKIAKKLFEVSNFHSLMAIIQSLNSTPIIRLSKTWTAVPKNQKSQFDRLLVLVREDENRSELRAHMQDVKLPCIPFLGMYLTDIMYIDAAHPYKGGIESHERTNKMNNVLRILADYQQSTYCQFSINRLIRDYLKSVTYIEELQKFLEEDNYKLSLKIEPIQPNSSPDKKQKTKAELMADLGISLKPSDRLDACNLPSSQSFSPGHRKTRSLGKECNFNGAMKNKSENPQTKSGSLPRTTFPSVTTSLLDDSIIATTSSGQMALHPVSSGSIRSSLSNSASDHSEQEDISWTSEHQTESGSGSSSKFEGCVRRKCVLKHGKKPSVSTFTRYWMALYDTTLVYYAAKAVRATERQHYKTQSCKKMSVYGWTLLRSTDPDKQEYFQLRDPKETTVYRFHCDSTEMALVWMSVLEEATKGHPQVNNRPERDLINLDDS